MKKFNSIIAFGDSFVAGTELCTDEQVEEVYNKIKSGLYPVDEIDDITKPNSFPNLLAKKLNIPCHNYAMSGSSNNRSIRKLISATKIHTNSLILFGYTSPDRSEIYYPVEGPCAGRDSDMFLQLGIHINNHGINFELNQTYIRDFIYPHNNINEFIICAEAIAKYTSNQIIHLPVFGDYVHEPLPNIFKFQGYKNLIDWATFNRFSRLRHGHFEQAAHNALADLLFQQL